MTLREPLSCTKRRLSRYWRGGVSDGNGENGGGGDVPFLTRAGLGAWLRMEDGDG